ncbi:MAG: adenosine kinase [Bacteroidaceae bacterium]|nr:adenosine kinase [Bacteroidaceae bacterium]
MKKIIGIGNALVDALATLQDDELLGVFGLPKGSMTLIGDEEQQRIQERFAALDVQRATGGSAGNTMLALANLGAAPGFIGTVGSDDTGRFFADNCVAKGIHPYLVELPKQSGIAYTFISPGGQRTFATYLGAAAMMEPSVLTKEMFEGYDYLYVEGYLVQNHALILRAVEMAKEMGLKVCLDLASYNIVEADKEFFTMLVSDYVDIVFANEEEARAFTGATPEEALTQLHELCDVAVVKLGAKGASLMRDGEKVFVEAMPVDKVVDTTAAGDFYAAGVMYGITQGYSLRQCAEIGTLLSGHVIQVVGTKLPAETWEAIRQEIACIAQNG